MVYRGLVRDGVIVLDGAEGLPEGTVVSVEAVGQEQAARAGNGTVHLGGSDANHRSEVGDRLLGSHWQTSAEGMRAQQRVDHVL